GLSRLMAAVDLQEDATLRERAVHALGELGDTRAVDLLLKMVNDPEHPLRHTAVEAVGRMGRSAKADEILTLLKELTRGDSRMVAAALCGLRWFDHPEGWQIIRRYAVDARSPVQMVAVELLGNNDDPTTRDVLLRIVMESSDHLLVTTAYMSA